MRQPDPAAEAYPLTWPAGRARSDFRNASKFKVQSLARVRDELLNELKLMRAKRVVLSTNLMLRRDGLPLADQSRPRDPGVAVYFRYKDKPVCFACDRWDKIKDNLQAIAHTINALRGIARWGTGDMVDAAFTGFAALPAAMTVPRRWWEVLNVDRTADAATVEDAVRSRRMETHPDRGGSTEAFQEVEAAWESFKEEREAA